MECLKEPHLFVIGIFCNIITVFTVTFDEFKASLLNERIHLFQKKKKSSWSQTFKQYCTYWGEGKKREEWKARLQSAGNSINVQCRPFT